MFKCRFHFNHNRTGPSGWLGTMFRKYRYRTAGWVAVMAIGPGAGYIGGSAMFIAWRSGSLRWLKNHNGGKPVSSSPLKQGYIRLGWLEFGWTGNANLVPYTSS